MNRLKYNFSNRERILLLVLAVIILVLGYYKLILEPINTQISQYNAAASTEQEYINTNLQVAGQVIALKEEIEELKKSGEAKPVPQYDNSAGLVIELNDILSSAVTYKIDFRENASSESYLVESVVNLEMYTRTYAEARNILNRLHESSNINQITNLTIDLSDRNAGQVMTSLVITFYETKS